MGYKHIIFDLDGTLTDPAPGITNSIIYALGKLGITPPDRRELYCCIGPPLIDSFERLWGFSREKAVEALFLYREYFSVKGLFENKVYTGIEKMLANLVGSGKTLYVATSKPELYAKQILEHFSLDGYFTFVAGNTMSESRHKKSDVIKYLAGKFPEITASDAVMVGDTEYDIEGASEAGFNCIAVYYGYGNADKISKTNAQKVYSVKELEELLMR